MIHFVHFQTFPNMPKSAQKFFYYCTRLPGIKTAIEELLSMKRPAKSKHDANASQSYLFEVICLCIYVSCVVQNSKQNRLLYRSVTSLGHQGVRRVF